MKKTWTLILGYIKKETVLCVAALLALISSFLVTPDAQYAAYIDFDTLLLLFSLMAVMAGFQRLGLFRLLGGKLLALVKNVRQMLLVLVFLPFFFSMLITNDVALITFVPFAIVVLRLSAKERLLVPLVVLQTIAANMGSMLTPLGNPQNLYLYARSGISLPSFIGLMLPYTLVAALCLLAAVFFITRRESSSGSAPLIPDGKQDQNRPANVKCRAALYSAAFVLCLLTVAKILPPYALAGIILVLFLILDRRALLDVDYALLFTFVGFFIFIGNMGRLPAFRNFLSSILDGHEGLIAVLLSQIISNVPAALLLSGFTDRYHALIVGVNLGGLGTLIASMASLISYKQLAREYPRQKRRYFLCFTIANTAMLLILAGAGFLKEMLL